MKKIAKLALHRETVRTLSPIEAGLAAGGTLITDASCYGGCHVPRPNTTTKFI